MLRFLLPLIAIASLQGQLIVDTYAGGAIPSGVPAQNVPIGFLSGLTWDPSGNIVYCDVVYNVIRRVRVDGIVETIAGTAVTGFAGDGGPASSALINAPVGAQYDPSGNLYFLDFNNRRIRRIDTSGVITTVAGDGQSFVTGMDIEGLATSRSLPYPSNFAVDGSGDVYIAGNNNVVRVTPAGNLEMVAQVPGAGGMVIDGMGNVYVGTGPPEGLLRITPAGMITTFITFPPSEPFGNNIALVSADAMGNVYVLLNGQLLRYAPNGTSTVLTTPSGVQPMLARDPAGNLVFLATQFSGNVLSTLETFTTESVLTTVAGGTPKPAPDGTPLSNAWFLGPISIALSNTGDLYVADFGACLIRKISAAGFLSTFAGAGTCGLPATSSNAKMSNLYYPNSIAVDSNDKVWVTDQSGYVYSISQQGALALVVPPDLDVGSPLGLLQLAVDAENRVYLMGKDSLSRVLADGTEQALIPTPGSGIPAAFQDLTAIGVDYGGNVYFDATMANSITGSGGTTLYAVNSDGTIAMKGPIFAAGGLTFDRGGNAWGSSGNLSTSNSTGISSIGSARGSAGDGGPAQSALMSAYGSVAFGPDGNLYFVDGSYDSDLASRIRRVTGSGPSIAPAISANGIVNAVSYAGGAIAPGELISIFGSNFGARSLQVNTAPNNIIPQAIGRTKVLFNGSPGAITASTDNQINVFVPQLLTPGISVNIQVQVDNILSTAVAIPVVETAPGLSTSILNQDGTLNSSTNPAARGSIVSLYGTGLGAEVPQLPDGYLAISTPYSSPVNSPSVTIGGQNATILYAGDAPTLPTGVFQINVQIPTSINAGATTVFVGTVGSSTSLPIAIALK